MLDDEHAGPDFALSPTCPPVASPACLPFVSYLSPTLSNAVLPFVLVFHLQPMLFHHDLPLSPICLPFVASLEPYCSRTERRSHFFVPQEILVFLRGVMLFYHDFSSTAVHLSQLHLVLGSSFFNRDVLFHSDLSQASTSQLRMTRH